MKTPIKQLIPLSFFAGFGAPVAFVAYACVDLTLSGRELDFSNLNLMFTTVLLFSWLITMGLALVTMGVAWLLRFESVDIFIWASSLFVLMCLLIAIRYGLGSLALFGLAALANAVILVVLGRRWAKPADEKKL